MKFDLLVKMAGRVGGFMVIACHASPALTQPTAADLWTDERVGAVVRIETPKTSEVESGVGTGVIVGGLGKRQYVLTATHVLNPKAKLTDAPVPGCFPLLPEVKLFLGDTGGDPIRSSCVHHLGSDVSLIELSRRVQPYPVLLLSARLLQNEEEVALAGFPQGRDRQQRRGLVKDLSGPDNMIGTDIGTAGGMSGGPYLNTDGFVVGIHHGGIRHAPTFPYMIPIWKVRPALEQYLPRIPLDRAGRPPVFGVASAEGAYRHVAERLVFIETRQIPSGEECASSAAPVVQRSTGFLFGERHVLTAFEVFGQPLQTGHQPCLRVYQDSDRDYAISAIAVDSPAQQRIKVGRDLAMLPLTRSAPHVVGCFPISDDEPSTSVFLIGYNAEADAANDRAEALREERRLKPRRCREQCDTEGGTQAGRRGGPVIDRKGQLAGIIMADDSIQVTFASLIPFRNSITQDQTYCPSPPAKQETAVCEERERGRLMQPKSFSEPKEVVCSRNGKPSDSAFATRQAENGYFITGFVTHEDDVDEYGYGWVDTVEYGPNDAGNIATHITFVRVKVNCALPEEGGAMTGRAKTTINGKLRKITITSDDERTIRETCSRRQ